MWFIGLEFDKSETVNIDLTADIQSFIDTVRNTAAQNNKLKEEMRIDAKHVRRKDLTNYLPTETIRRGIKTPAKIPSTGSDGDQKNDENSSQPNGNGKETIVEMLTTDGLADQSLDTSLTEINLKRKPEVTHEDEEVLKRSKIDDTELGDTDTRALLSADI
jgi:poly(A) polymerase